ncbi:MAG: tetratricopeptide repeat protein [Desulfobacterota bacterium]|nr:tetratricopeptide repeat protein [Thermodesulfobacteriota bacterium]
MRWIRFLYFMIPVLGSVLKDLFLRPQSGKENRLHYLLGQADAYDRAGLTDRSIRIYERLLKKSPDSIPIYMNLGGAYLRKGRFDKAIPFYEQVVRLNPRHYQGHYWLAVCYYRMERYFAAIHTLEEVLEFLPTFKDALNLLGECYERIGEGAKAEHYYLKAISAEAQGRVIQAGLLHPPGQDKKRAERIRH